MNKKYSINDITKAMNLHDVFQEKNLSVKKTLELIGKCEEILWALKEMDPQDLTVTERSIFLKLNRVLPIDKERI